MFKERLKELREAKGLTQSQLSEKLKIGRTSVSNYELGTRTPDIEPLCKIADYFNVTTDYLTGRCNYKTSKEELEYEGITLSLEDLLAPINEDVKQHIIKEMYKFKDYTIQLTDFSNDNNDFDSLYSYFLILNKIYTFYFELSSYQIKKKVEFNSYFLNNTLCDSKEKFTDFLLECLNNTKLDDEDFSVYTNDILIEINKIISDTKHKAKDILYSHMEDIIKHMI